MTELLVLGGERVAAAEGATTDVVEPSTGKPGMGGRAGVAGGRSPRRRRRGRGVRDGPVASDERSRAGTRADEGLVPDP